MGGICLKHVRLRQTDDRGQATIFLTVSRDKARVLSFRRSTHYGIQHGHPVQVMPRIAFTILQDLGSDSLLSSMSIAWRPENARGVAPLEFELDESEQVSPSFRQQQCTDTLRHRLQWGLFIVGRTSALGKPHHEQNRARSVQWGAQHRTSEQSGSQRYSYPTKKIGGAPGMLNTIPGPPSSCLSPLRLSRNLGLLFLCAPRGRTLFFLRVFRACATQDHLRVREHSQQTSSVVYRGRHVGRSGRVEFPIGDVMPSCWQARRHSRGPHGHKGKSRHG